MKSSACFFATLALLLGAAAYGKGQPSYVYTTLDVPGSTGTAIYGINNAGEIVGAYADAGGGHSFLLSDGRYTIFDGPPGSVSYSVQGINDARHIVGSYQNSLLSDAVGYLLSGGNYTKLVVPGSLATYPLAINDAGQIVGYYSTGERGPYHGFILSEGRYTTITGPPGSAGDTIAYAINNAGHIVIGSSLGTFLVTGDTYTRLNLPGAPTGLSDADQVIGTYLDTRRHGYLWSDGFLTTLDVPGSAFDGATGINDAGQIVGTYVLADGSVHGFLATPVPEPPGFLLLGVGAICLGGWLWQRSRYRVGYS